VRRIVVIVWPSLKSSKWGSVGRAATLAPGVRPCKISVLEMTSNRLNHPPLPPDVQDALVTEDPPGRESMPERLAFADALPRTEFGKVRRDDVKRWLT